MKPRAFVVMPFGEKTELDLSQSDLSQQWKRVSDSRRINFEAVYKDLIEPALNQAGYEVARADSANNAGDIRTDMFFELVTADLVVADVTIPNPNVYYELGVRHGVCPQGVFIISGNLQGSRPFDIAPDRTFSYDISPFLCSIGAGTVASAALNVLEDDRASLAKKFTDATTLDRETVGSPVYAHLPGLKPVNWEGIETSKAKHFNTLQSDWLDWVHNAQGSGYPGDILTLAMNSPTRFHETRILYEAAIALIDLCRYAAAERVLRDVIRLDPSNDEARFQFALVLSHLGKTIPAEQQLRRILREHKSVPRAADLLGQVFRYLWYLGWKKEKPEDRPEKAREAAQLARTAIHNFVRAHRADPAAFFAGFNAIMLAHVLQHIGIQVEHDFTVDLSELTTVVRYVAKNQQQHALAEGQYVQQFWCTTTLAGIHLIEGEGDMALSAIQEACALPGATSFQLQTFLDRLDLLGDLDQHCPFVQKALSIVSEAIKSRDRECKTCERVLLWGGYPIEQPGRPGFAADDVSRISGEIDCALNHWGLSANDLAICSGMTESDILFAKACLDRHVRVRLMIREPVGEELNQPLWPFAEPDWREKFHELRANNLIDVWEDTEHLGSPPKGNSANDAGEFVRRRHNQWLLNTACMEAEPKTIVEREEPLSEQVAIPCKKAQSGAPVSPSPPRLYGLFLWDGKGNPNDPKDIPYLIRRISDYAEYQGQVTIIPMEIPQNDAGNPKANHANAGWG